MSPSNRSVARSELPEGPPSGYFIVVPPDPDEGVAHMSRLFSTLASSWRLLLAMTLAVAVVTAVISLLMAKVYRAQVLIAPVAQSNGGVAGGLRNQLGGLAALAGLDLSSAGQRKEEYLATLSSESFAREFIQSQNLLPILFADRWDASAGHWKTDAPAPTLAAAVRKFTRSVRFVEEDHKTGLITVTVEWSSPQLAASWANELVDRVNERIRAEATRDSERSIEYLNKELEKSSVVELHQAIYRLIEDQVNQAMLAAVQREYAFRVIDPAVAPELRIRPQRTLMVMVGALLGMLLGVAIVLTRSTMTGKRAS
jgi:uncharacterized protein involved in exopolysaccharide biosynthesis